MNSSTEEKYEMQHLSISAAAAITYIAGILINGFIFAVMVTDWVKGRPVTATDQVLTSLGITRIFCLSISLLDVFLHSFFKKSSIIYLIVFCMFEISFYAGIWLSNLLSVVFCLKICNFHNVFFRRLKIIILQRVVSLIAACVLVPLCYFTIFILLTIIEMPKNSFNTTYTEEVYEIHRYMSVLWSSGLFLMFLLSSFLLIISLCYHMKRMQRDGTVTGQVNIYYRTITFLTISLVSYAFYFVTNKTLSFSEGSLDDLELICIFNLFPTLHSMYLIYVTARLRTRLSAILQHGTNCWLNSRRCSSEAGDPVETITQRF
ncbi:taste receptor type 2 member 43-like [Pseudophryne corroboree]|uniref:taste receptor type 2 member 43-like n=1 Tax=Pseudophryne corroboree TaxID=495146 RepID=UPI003081C3E0